MNGNAKAWIAALRSNDYQQTKHALKTEDGYCCLGVACEISKLGSFKARNSGVYFFLSERFRGDELRNTGDMPPHIKTHYGLVSDIVVLDYVDTAHVGDSSLKIAELNDWHGLSFNQIADILEKYQDQLFE
jgi:hypothetical protein